MNRYDILLNKKPSLFDKMDPLTLETFKESMKDFQLKSRPSSLLSNFSIGPPRYKRDEPIPFRGSDQTGNDQTSQYPMYELFDISFVREGGVPIIGNSIV